MNTINYGDVRDAYAASGLKPCRCGPEWHRLPGGEIGAGPFMALYCQASWLIVTPEMSDAALDALAEAAERWGRDTWGVEYYAAFQAGFEHCDTLSSGGSAVCTPVERRALFDGSLASEVVESVPAPSQPLSVVSYYTCNGSPQGCERQRFGQCDHHDERKAGVAC